MSFLDEDELCTGTGMIGDVIERSTDIAVGGSYKWIYFFVFMIFSNVMQQVTIVMIVPRSHLVPYYEVTYILFRHFCSKTRNALQNCYQCPTFQTPSLPFSGLIWICLFASYIMNAILLYAFETIILQIYRIATRKVVKKKSLDYAILNTFRLIVLQGTTFE